jgi:hypothetical protein
MRNRTGLVGYPYRNNRSRNFVQPFPGFSLNPDISPEFAETSMGRILLGPKKDPDEAAEELAASYGG